MRKYPDDIFTEPDNVDPDTLANLGPLRPLAGVWTSNAGVDIHLAGHGANTQAFVERLELQPIDPQTNGPQLLYGLRYHQRMVKPGEVETYHDQIGYWLWEPATGAIVQTLAIPRAQVALAIGEAKPDDTEFELVAKRGETVNGIASGPFLEHAFKTIHYRIKVTVHADGRWSYDETTLLQVKGRAEPFEHTDTATLVKIAEPTPNPAARKAASA
ncbi:FABP family protein [Roseiarcus fermentans]|nr:heme-binding beta-barrel domain-containing protein [Roseiarcus fermentans]